MPKGTNFVLINRLYRERLLFLGQEVDSEISNQLVGLMVYLSIEDATRDLYLFITRRMGNTRNSHLWYYAICATRCAYNMHGISRFNGIFHSGRRRNYQTYSIPSRLAPMSFFIWKKKRKTMPSPYWIWIISNNSMALRVRYEQTIIVFFITWDFMSR